LGTIREIIVNLIAGFIAEACFILLAVFAPDISALIGLQPNLLQLLAIISFIIVGLLLIQIYSVRKKFRNRKMFAVVKQRPRHIVKNGELNHFGVKWNVLIGSLLRLTDTYTFIEGPFCPTCNFKLISRIVGKWLGLASKPVWHCATCNKNFDRPKKYLYEEDEFVEKIVGSQFR